MFRIAGRSVLAGDIEDERHQYDSVLSDFVPVDHDRGRPSTGVVETT